MRKYCIILNAVFYILIDYQSINNLKFDWHKKFACRFATQNVQKRFRETIYRKVHLIYIINKP